MEIINVKIVNTNLTGSRKTKAVKMVKTWKAFKRNLAAGKKEKDLTGIGPYLEVEVKEEKDSANLTVKVPFFLASNKNKLVDENVVNRINPLALRIMEEYYRSHYSSFDIEAYKSAEVAKIDDAISALGATPDADELAALNSKKAKVTALVKKDTQKLLRDKVVELEEIPNEIDLSKYRSTKAKVNEMKKFASKKEDLIKTKSTLKKLKWSEKRGFSKLNNKVFKRVTAIILAGAFATSATVTKLFGLWPKNGLFSKNKKVVSDQTGKNITINDDTTISEIAELVKTTPTVKLTATPTIKPTPTIQKYNVDSDYFKNLCAVNYDKFSYIEKNINKYYNYASCIEAYTLLENLDSLDTSRISKNVLKNSITSARALIAFLITYNPVCSDYINIREYNKPIVQDILNGKYDSGINYVKNASESSEPIIDMLTIGQLEEAYMSNVSDFDNNIYYKEIDEYIKVIVDGSYKISYIEPAKIKSLGSYPII